MNHKQAVELQLAVKYVLGELPPVQREEYEDHYIDCPECAQDVHAAAAFADTAREVFRQEARNEAPARDPVRGGWFAWLRPVVAVPAFAVLLLALGYEGFVTVPHWKARATQATASRVLPMFSLIAANTRGPDSLTFQVRPGERFGLYVDVPTDAAYGSYLLRLEDPEGRSMNLSAVSPAEAQKTQVVEVNAGNRSGAYQLVVLGLRSPESDRAKATVLATMKFHVEVNK
jgi:hypothetical protein